MAKWQKTFYVDSATLEFVEQGHDVEDTTTWQEQNLTVEISSADQVADVKEKVEAEIKEIAKRSLARGVTKLKVLNFSSAPEITEDWLAEFIANDGKDGDVHEI